MKTVLIVDDEKHIRKLLKKILSFKGYKTFEAGNADEAINVVNNENPNVVLIDYNMPGELNGLDALSIIRKNRCKCTTKVIVMSASAEKGLESKSLKLGANAFYAKPFRTSVLLKKIELLAA